MGAEGYNIYLSTPISIYNATKRPDIKEEKIKYQQNIMPFLSLRNPPHGSHGPTIISPKKILLTIS
jgi:hypothetical protein